MDNIFGDEGAPVPQLDVETNEIRTSNGSDPEIHRLRRSISLHPRFLSEMEHEALLASKRQRSQHRNSLHTSFRQIYSFMTGARANSDRGEYESLPVGTS